MPALFTELGVVLTSALGFIGDLVAEPVIAIPIYIGLLGTVIAFVRRQLPGRKKK